MTSATTATTTIAVVTSPLRVRFNLDPHHVAALAVVTSPARPSNVSALQLRAARLAGYANVWRVSWKRLLGERVRMATLPARHEGDPRTNVQEQPAQDSPSSPMRLVLINKKHQCKYRQPDRGGRERHEHVR